MPPCATPGIPVAVVSNKFDAAVKALSAAYFGDLIPVAVGERDGVRKKPAPDTVFEALRLLGVPADGTPSPVYIGDSDVVSPPPPPPDSPASP